MNSKNIALLTISLALFFTAFMSSAVNIALPEIGAEFKADAVMLGWVATSYLLTSAAFLIPFGRISDIVGNKKMFGYGMVAYTITSAASALSTSVPMLVGFRALQGISGAMVMANSAALISALFPQGERGRALGIYSSAVYLGLSVGPFLGGLVTEHLGWKYIFLMNIPAGLIVIPLIFGVVKSEFRGGRGEKFDLTGSIIFGVTFMALTYGFTALPEVIGAILVPLGILGLFIFYKWETKVKSPIVNLELFKNRAFIFSNMAALIHYAATFAVVFIMSLYLQYIKGLSPENAGLILVAQPAVQAMLSIFSGRLSDRMEPRIVASVGMAVTCLGLILFSFLTQGTPISMIITVLIILGIGLGVFVSPNTNAIMSSIEPKVYGVASATANTMRQVGMVLSMGIAMIVISIYLGRAEVTPEHYQTFVTCARVVFIIFAVLCFGGIFASLSRGKVR
jgi:EmrB/QacA subfamily drug resistance transporter